MKVVFRENTALSFLSLYSLQFNADAMETSSIFHGNIMKNIQNVLGHFGCTGTKKQNLKIYLNENPKFNLVIHVTERSLSRHFLMTSAILWLAARSIRHCDTK
jgi:hypothetical protein